MISPDEHIVFRPLAAPMPVPRVDSLMVHLSGFTTGETVYLRRLLRAIGEY
jgi:DNA replication regulator DPB11